MARLENKFLKINKLNDVLYMNIAIEIQFMKICENNLFRSYNAPVMTPCFMTANRIWQHHYKVS